MIRVDYLDHLVLTVRNIESTCDFYSICLGFEVIMFAENRVALKFGDQKINLYQAGNEFQPKAQHPTPGSADLCFITHTPLSDVLAHLRANHIEIIEGPVRRTGATGMISSIYVRDPDQNLIEIANYIS